jgi:hypothetical protein
MDKRFWSGAVIVVTVAVAGAGALPTLLLRPSVEPIPFEATFAAAAIASQPEPKQAPTVPPPAPPPAVASTPSPMVASAPVALQEPRKAEPEVASPSVVTTAAVVVPVPEPAREAKAEAFPPVQPVGIATGAPDVSPQVEKPLSVSARRGARKWIRVVHLRPVHAARRSGHIRPAAYPIREFLAWRR